MELKHPTHIASHVIEITGRVVRLVLGGDFDEGHSRRYAELVDAAIPAGEPYAVIGNCVKMGALGPAARRYLTRWHTKHRCERCVVVGASLLVRGIMTLIVRAMSLTGKHVINISFVASEAEAEACIADWERTHPPLK